MRESLYRTILQDAHTKIDVGYYNAIQHYNQLKKNFIQKLNLNLNNGSRYTTLNFIQKLNREVENELNNNKSEWMDQIDEVLNTLQNELLPHIRKALGGKGGQNLKTYVNDNKTFKRKSGVRSETSLYHYVIPEIEHFIQTEIYQKVSKESIKEYLGTIWKGGIGKNSNSDIENQLFGYLRKTIFNRVLYGSQSPRVNVIRTNFKNALKGYLKEEVLQAALTKGLQKLNLTTLGTGSQVNSKNQQIKYDLIIAGTPLVQASGNSQKNILDNAVNALEQVSSFNVNASKTFGNVPIAGIQSKSWNLVFDNQSNLINSKATREFLEIGGADAYKPLGEEAYYWHAGVRNAMDNIIELIGPGNILFSNGSSITWTADLLTTFKESNYVLAFYKRTSSGKIVSSNVGFMSHNDSKYI